MPRVAKELKAAEVARLTTPGMHPVGVVPGLHLQVAESGARSWILRVTVPGGKRREMGLGGYPAVTLAGAHAAAREARAKLREGVDPLQERREARSRRLAEILAQRTFQQCAEEYMQTHAAGWKNPKHAAQWRATLEAYAFPVLGSMLVRDVEREHVLRVLQPIWTEKTETATRLRGRIELVLSYAMQAGYRPEGFNPARWKGGLDKTLAAPTKIAKVEHFAALPLDAMGAFMRRLREAEGMGALAVEFAILTAARSGEVRGATWGEIDRTARVWTIPAERMKAGAEHQVPLSDAALAVLDKLKAGETPDPSALVFPAVRGGMLSDMTLTAVLRRMEVPATVHGFRSTFRDWCAERTTYPRDLAEMALAHTVGDKVEAAYRRGTMFARRVPMMAEWAQFVGTVQRPAGVVGIATARAA